MSRRDPHHRGDAATSRTPDVIEQARRRRLKRLMTAVLVGIVVASYTLGALSVRVDVEERNDLLPVPLEAIMMGVAFALGSLPVGWSVVARAVIPVPTFFLYLTVFLGKSQPLPFYAAFVIAGLYSAALTALAAYLAERSGGPRLRNWKRN
jgi:MFS family permease